MNVSALPDGGCCYSLGDYSSQGGGIGGASRGNHATIQMQANAVLVMSAVFSATLAMNYSVSVGGWMGVQ